MQSYVVVRLDIDAIPDGLPPMAERGQRVSTLMQDMSDAELQALAQRRGRSNPPMNLRPVAIAMDEQALRRLKNLPRGASVSALVQYLLGMGIKGGVTR